MTELYTVRMKRKQIVSIFDARGKKIREETRLLDQVYTDLPYSTALMYREKSPDADVKIERQVPEREVRSRAKHKVITSGIAEYSPRKRSSAEEKPARKDEAPAAHDYKALVNEMMKEAAE